MKNRLLILLNYLTWGFILGFITGVNISIFINFTSPPFTNSTVAFQFIFDHVFNWTLNGLYVSGLLGGLYLLCRSSNQINRNKSIY